MSSQNIREQVQGNNRSQRDLVKEDTWRRIFQECDASGKSGRQFCKSRGLSEHQFYSWRAVIRKRDSKGKREQREATNPFVLLQFTENHINQAQEVPIEMVFPGGALIRITGQTNLGLVCRILTEMEKSKC